MYSCNTGYQLSGSATAICEMEEIDLFYWISVPTCIGINATNNLSVVYTFLFSIGSPYEYKGDELNQVQISLLLY